MKENEQSLFIANYLMETWKELADFLLRHPDKLAISQAAYWQDYCQLCQEYPGSQETSDAGKHSADKRFHSSEWQNNLIYNFIQRSYQLLAKHVEKLSGSLGIEDEKIRQKLQFYSRQYIDSIAPGNFIGSNPEVLAKTIETNGANLVEGFRQFQQDLQSGNGQLQISLTDITQFEVGKNIGCTRGHVIYQNDLMQLIQYNASTESVYENPILVIPPWINKYYILDLQQDNSLVKWMVDQGHTVFMISWVNPGSEHKDKEFSDYLNEGPLTALKVIKEVTGNQAINIVGYCIGGTLLGCLLAYLAQKPDDSNILSATFLTTLLDFSEPGELGTFIDEKQLGMLENYMQKKGYLDGSIMASVFNALRANDLIWAAFISNYLKGEKPKAFDLLYWNADSTNIPAATHSFYLRNMYLHNHLAQPGKIQMNGVALDLGKIDVPNYFLAAHDDHIVSWKSSYRSQDAFQKPGKFVLARSGHVAGVVNPPHKNKYGYWTNEKKRATVDKFLESAAFHEGSWWTDWGNWIKQYAGNMIPAHGVQSHAIEPAPGSYVKVRLADITVQEP